MKGNYSSIVLEKTDGIKHLTCQLCGQTGPDVHHSQAYVGGSGYTWFTVCRDEKDCRARMEARHASN